MKKIMIINPGSTGTKYKIFNHQGEVLDEQSFTLLEQKKEDSFLSALHNIEKIGVRIVHGGEITKTSKITQELKNIISECVDFAPIHNTRALMIIEKIESFFPEIPQYACFDTAFHMDIQESLYTYPIQQNIAKKYKLRKYGFHGIAVKSALHKFQATGINSEKIIVAHLGGGCSITAIKNGKSFCTSMELTPLSGVMMTTRSGSIDPDIVNILLKKEYSKFSEISEMLNKYSGFYGLTGSTDTLEIFNRAREGKPKEKLAFDIFVNQIVEKICGYAGLMGGIDSIIFSGGIGFGNAYLREEISQRIKFLGLDGHDIVPIDVDEELLIFEEILFLE